MLYLSPLDDCLNGFLLAGFYRSLLHFARFTIQYVVVDDTQTFLALPFVREYVSSRAVAVVGHALSQTRNMMFTYFRE